MRADGLFLTIAWNKFSADTIWLFFHHSYAQVHAVAGDVLPKFPRCAGPVNHIHAPRQIAVGKSDLQLAQCAQLSGHVAHGAIV
jgi:hypothetical protein